MAKENIRLVEIDALRGLAALSVVLFHFTQRFFDLFSPEIAPSIMVERGYYGVNLFFIISGLVIFMTLNRTKKPMDFVVSRFSRLFPAYWCAIFLTFFITNALELPIKTVTFLQALANLPMIHGIFGVPHVDGVYWTLEVELIFYAIMFALYRCGQLARIVPFTSAFLALRILYTILDRHAGIELSWTLSRLLILEHIAWFALGIAIYLGVIQKSATRSTSCIFLALLAIFTIGYADGLTKGFIAVLLACVAWAAVAGKLRWLGHPMLVWLGAISYPLYLLHENIGWSVQLQLVQHGINIDLAVLITLAFALLMATALHHCVEKPAMRSIRALYSGKSQPVL